jgi:hypothetical protein
MRFEFEKTKTPTLREFLTDHEKEGLVIYPEAFWIVKRIFFSQWKRGLVLVTDDFKVTLDQHLTPIVKPTQELIVRAVERNQLLLVGGLSQKNKNAFEIEAFPEKGTFWVSDNWGVVLQQSPYPKSLSQLELFPQEINQDTSKPTEKEIGSWEERVAEWLSHNPEA